MTAATTAPALARRRATGTPKRAAVTFARVVGTGLSRALLHLRVEGVHHVPRTGPVLLAGNHTGILDGPLVFFLSPRRASFLTKSEVFVGAWARPCGWLSLIPVHRGQPDRVGVPPAGVDDREATAAPLRVVGHPVTGDAGDVLDDGLAAAQDAVDQGRLADVRAAHDRQDRLVGTVFGVVAGGGGRLGHAGCSVVRRRWSTRARRSCSAAPRTVERARGSPVGWSVMGGP